MRTRWATTYIYALVDPRINEIRYIGKSNDPKVRFENHVSVSEGATYKDHWILKLRKENLIPILQIIEEVPCYCWQEREIYWIQYFRDLGLKLTNTTNGGEGTLGVAFSEETKAKISRNRRGIPRSEEAKRKTSESLSKHFSNPLVRDELSKAVTKGWSEEAKKNVSASITKIWEQRKLSGGGQYGCIRI